MEKLFGNPRVFELDSASGVASAEGLAAGAQRDGHSAPVVLEEAKKRLRGAPAYREATGMPFVTVSYAQSIDGSIASKERKPLPLSSSESLILTHALRATHDTVLVGIGCVLADNPHLTVRLTAGENPQPVIVDSSLRCPLSVNLLHNNGCRPWIGTTDQADRNRQHLLEGEGARIIRVKSGQGKRVDLRALLHALSSLGVCTVMVEGGSKIITSFLTEHLVNQFVITVAPLFVGGLKALDASAAPLPFYLPRLVNTCFENVGGDLILLGDPVWTEV
jgi:GTP cyclohydrolase II